MVVKHRLHVACSFRSRSFHLETQHPFEGCLPEFAGSVPHPDADNEPLKYRLRHAHLARRASIGSDCLSFLLKTGPCRIADGMSRCPRDRRALVGDSNLHFERCKERASIFFIPRINDDRSHVLPLRRPLKTVSRFPDVDGEFLFGSGWSVEVSVCCSSDGTIHLLRVVESARGHLGPLLEGKSRMFEFEEVRRTRRRSW